MKTIYLACFLVLFGGCQKPVVYQVPYNPTKYVKAKELTAEQKIALLDQEAKKRHLKFRIYCTAPTQMYPNWKFQAEVQQSKTKWGLIYIEDGATPWWAGHGETQADAAFDAYNVLLNGGSPLMPEHAPVIDYEGKFCPPEIYGGQSK